MPLLMICVICVSQGRQVPDLYDLHDLAHVFLVWMCTTQILHNHADGYFIYTIYMIYLDHHLSEVWKLDQRPNG